VWQRFCDRFLKRPFLTVSISFINVANSVLWRMAIILKANKFNLIVTSVLFVFWYHSPNFLDTPRSLDLCIFNLNVSSCRVHRSQETVLIRSCCTKQWTQQSVERIPLPPYPHFILQYIGFSEHLLEITDLRDDKCLPVWASMLKQTVEYQTADVW
jgi:hypothetical protein